MFEGLRGGSSVSVGQSAGRSQDWSLPPGEPLAEATAAAAAATALSSRQLATELPPQPIILSESSSVVVPEKVFLLLVL